DGGVTTTVGLVVGSLLQVAAASAPARTMIPRSLFQPNTHLTAEAADIRRSRIDVGGTEHARRFHPDRNEAGLRRVNDEAFRMFRFDGNAHLAIAYPEPHAALARTEKKREHDLRRAGWRDQDGRLLGPTRPEYPALRIGVIVGIGDVGTRPLIDRF